MGRDPFLWTRTHLVSAEVAYGINHRAVPPLLNELGKHFGEVRTRRNYPVPETGATSGPEWDLIVRVVLTLTAAGGVEYLRRIIGSLADDTYKGLRRELLRAKRRHWRRLRVKQGVMIQIGSHRFVFDQSISDAEFKRQLDAAQAIVNRSPDAKLRLVDPTDEGGQWLWNKGRWRTTSESLAHSVGEEPRVVNDSTTATS